MLCRRPELYDALKALTGAALNDLLQHDDAPVIGPLPDLRHWRRFSQSSFVALRATAWHMPERASTVAWLDTFPEMTAVREIINADPVIRSRVDTVVGTEFAKQFRRLSWLLVEHLLEPIVLATGTYQVDEDAFEASYARLERGLLAAEIRMVEYVPLNAFITPGLDSIALADGLELQPMTDQQLSTAIRVHAVPGEFGGGPTSFEVSWLNQWALVVERSFPVRSGADELSGIPVAGPFPSLSGPAEQLVRALRIVCGGSVSATRPIHIQHDEDFPFDLGSSAILSPVGLADLDRPTRMDSDQLGDLREVFRLLADPDVQSNRALQTALRRLVASGSRSVTEDRLVDLMTSAEALFIKLDGVKSKTKGAVIAGGAAALLAEDVVLATSPDKIRAFMSLAYQLRNDEIHGDDPARRPAHLLDGTPTTSLEAIVDDVERVMRRAAHLILRGVVYPRVTGQGMGVSDQETIERFVLRARRVAAHSLMQDRESFTKLMQDNFTLRMALDGTATLSRSLPADQEIFESLAARVRPLTLESESIFYKKVLAALKRMIKAASTPGSRELEQLTELTSEWTAMSLGRDVQVYEMWLSNADDTETTGRATDNQLAAGWIYADLVHADATGWKQDALAFSLEERYAAAVSVISRLASLSSRTLEFVRQLHDSNTIELERTVWDTAVVVASTELVLASATAYVGPVGTVPDWNQPLTELGEQWQQVTLTSQLRRDRTSHVQVDLTDTAGGIVASYDAAVLDRHQEDDILHWRVLLADSVISHVQLRVEDEGARPIAIDHSIVGDSNRVRLAAHRALQNMQRAHTMTYLVQGTTVVSCQTAPSRPEAVDQLQQLIETLEDVVAIEELSGRNIEPATEPITFFQRVRLRQMRLLWQGKIVQWDRVLPDAVLPEGKVPSWIRVEADLIPIGGAQVPTPEVLIGHPDATWIDQGPVAESEPARRFSASPPEGQRFLAWAPSRKGEPDQEQWESVRWNLAGITEDTCPF
ncbi:hypothetical protein MUY14_07340 [Amycolatopsis sp. FBCC-B4732]|uniref:hypothetical protein n=1 Tax=Amycolatopsis sp. FBCC-B4732 TaxID=3079339 RepID=UPI001FF1C35A|nr:hypothetical protein [Amycolatopsis sp. FBCC-B4732]UOX90429.1 hypothetical protein MUY14_07340 [Amycolatopsis sp. FBCC-B4732]